MKKFNFVESRKHNVRLRGSRQTCVCFSEFLIRDIFVCISSTSLKGSLSSLPYDVSTSTHGVKVFIFFLISLIQKV